MSPIIQVQLNAAAILNGDAYFNDPDPLRRIVVLTQRLGDVASQLETAIETLGLAVVVVTPLVKLPEPNVDALELDVPFIVQIQEEPTTNEGEQGSQKPALDVACEVMCLLHGAPTGLGNPRTNRFHCTETPLSLVDEKPTYHVNLTARVTLTPRRAQPAPGTP